MAQRFFSILCNSNDQHSPTNHKHLSQYEKQCQVCIGIQLASHEHSGSTEMFKNIAGIDLNGEFQMFTFSQFECGI